ncbi:MAG: phenylalanine--tRNA ligase alpha subunit [Pirellulaceae bacterium]|nr:MAG: phenylalanine--tRNA ligase alpha subunit [Pirellulaceae bacterium]
MSFERFTAELDALWRAASQAFSQVSDPAALEAARVEFLGARSGRLKALQKMLADIPPPQKPDAGRRFNQIKKELEEALRQAQQRLGSTAAARSRRPPLDPTLPGTRVGLGKLHPISHTIEELKEIMGRLGFTVADGPEVEDEWHNFEALNIPPDHPARDPLDNFYLSVAGQLCQPPLLLRSQTSTVQIRVMERMPPPVRIIALGRVYRPDEVDATHYPMFHQMEGLMVDRHVTMADLKSTLRLFAAAYLGQDAPIRFRPSFFPFTEPSVEVDFQWAGGWIEFGGAGMVDPAVLAAVGYDPEQVTGFAFGLGVERLCMRRHQIPDIRELYRNDVRFLRQF